MNKRINLRCSETFENLLHQKMTDAGYNSYSELIRDLVEGVRIKQRCQGLQALVKEINKIGVNLNQITRHVNETKMIDQLTLQGINDSYKNLSALVSRYNNVN